MRRVDAFTIRPAELFDAVVLAETVRQGFETYREFLPPGWDPPPEEFERSRIQERLEAGAFCLMAFAGEAPAGHVAFLGAHERAGERVLIPGLAHLWMLFIRRPWWGSGLATDLLARAVAEAGRRGFSEMRLFTPHGQLRARRFYEREGWSTTGIPMPEPMLGFDLVEYRRAL
jgi:GNAT superfamily N-acetyltransferase